MEFYSGILGVPREVGLIFRKIRITGKFRSIPPFLLGPVSPSLEIKTWAAFSYLRFYLTVLLEIIAVEWPYQALVSSAKIHVSYVQCGHDRTREQPREFESSFENVS